MLKEKTTEKTRNAVQEETHQKSAPEKPTSDPTTYGGIM